MGKPEHEDEDTVGIDDEQLPDDLVASEDNPLAEGLEDGESAGDLLEEGKPAEESDDAGDQRSDDSDDTDDA